MATRGATDKDTLHLARGNALNEWEMTENNLARLFCSILRAREFAICSKAYGAIAASKVRSDMIESAMEAHFLIWPSEPLAEKFKALNNKVGQFAGRRNEIAHSIIGDYRGPNGRRKAETYYLIPPPYMTGKRKLTRVKSRSSFHSTAGFAYNADDVDFYAREFLYLRAEISDFAQDVEINQARRRSR